MARSLLLMILFGWLAAGVPFRGDQALFTQYAREMANGNVLYRDLWDVTNPGVYWFYQLAGTLFGFDEDGIHLGEWIWVTALVLLVNAAIRRKHKAISLAPAILVGGWYYATSCADPSHLTKTEGLVALPIFGVSWLMTFDSRRMTVLAGVACGIIILFKLLFALLLIASCLPFLTARPRRILEIAIGSALPIILAIAYFASNDSLGLLFETLLITPQEILQHAEPADFPRLANSTRWFIETSTPLIVLAFAGSLLLWNDPLVRSLVYVFTAAIAVILIQRWSWWSYHFLLLSLPLAMLSAYTWPVIWFKLQERFPTQREQLAVVGILFVVFLPPISHAGLSLLRIVKHHGCLTASDRNAARFHTGTAYRIAETEARGKHGTMFVAGDPLIYRFCDGEPVTRYHGWSLELFTPAIWDQLLTELQAAPPQWFHISRELGYESLIQAKAPALWKWLQSNYRREGNWYEHQ